MPLHRIVVRAVVKIRFQPLANGKLILIGHGDIAKIEQTMDVGSQQQSVGYLVLATLPVRSDVSSVEIRQRLFARNRATTVIGVGDSQSKCALPESAPHGGWFPIALLRLGNS